MSEKSEVQQRIKRLIKEVVPPGLIRVARTLRPPPSSPYGYFGDYPTFDAAMADCKNEGYSNQEIVTKVSQQMRELKERQGDSGVSALLDARVLQNLAASLLAVSTITHRPLSVLDFGGALGMHYYQLRPFLPGGSELSWVVCETAVMAEEGRKHFASEHLEFISSLDDARGPFDLVIASGAIQCVPDVLEMLGRLAGLADQLLFNRLPLIPGDRNRLTIHKVDPAIYAASIPIWFVSERLWLAKLDELGFEVAMRWQVPQDVTFLDGTAVVLQGLLASRRRR